MPDEIRLTGALVLAVSASYAVTPAAIRLACRFRFYDHPAGYKAHAGPTPYLGGVAILAGFALGAGAFGGGLGTYAPIVIGAAFVWLVGTADDRRPLPPLERLAAIAAAGGFLWASGLGWSVGSAVVNPLLTIGWVMCVVVAFNLMDNSDGAASVVGAVSLAGVAAVATIHGSAVLAALALALAGACLAFLRYNLASPSRIFLGDGGSMVIGFVAAAGVMALPPAVTAGWAVLVPATLLVGLPAFDTALVVVSRYRRRVTIWMGGRDHITYRLATRVASVRAVACLLGTMQAVLCLLALVLVGAGTGAALAAALPLLALAGLALWLLDTAAWQPPWNTVSVQVAGGEGAAVSAGANGTDPHELVAVPTAGSGDAPSEGGAVPAPGQRRPVAQTE